MTTRRSDMFGDIFRRANENRRCCGRCSRVLKQVEARFSSTIVSHIYVSIESRDEFVNKLFIVLHRCNVERRMSTIRPDVDVRLLVAQPRDDVRPSVFSGPVYGSISGSEVPRVDLKYNRIECIFSNMYQST